MKSWFEVKVRAMLGPDDKDDKEVVLLGRIMRWLGTRWNGKQTLNIGRRCWNTSGWMREP